jgi:predicted Zn-dependent peptidase
VPIKTKPQGQDFGIAELPNGIRMVHVHTGGPVAHVAVYVNAGTRDEPEGQNGLAHFIEHTLFKGTKKRKAYHVLTRLENVGGDLNAFTTKEETCIYATVLSEHFSRAIELISDIIIRPTFPDHEIRKEKDVILDEINSYKDTPSEEIYDVLEEQVFRNHPMGRNILGNPEQIVDFTRSDALEFIRKHYTGGNMIVCTSGDIRFSRALSVVKKYFEEVSEGKPDAERKSFASYESFNLSMERSTFQAHCMLGNLAYHRRDERRFPLFLLNNILGGPAMNSRLNLAVRERHGYAYAVESAFLPYTDTGIFSIYLGTDNGNLGKSLRLIRKEMDRLAAEPLSSLQLSQAKKQLIGQIEIANESNLNHLLSAGKAFLHDHRLDNADEIRGKIEAITTEQLLETARDIFNTAQISTLIFQNKST